MLITAGFRTRTGKHPGVLVTLEGGQPAVYSEEPRPALGYLATHETRADALPGERCLFPPDNSSLGFSVLVNWNLYCIGENRLDCSGPLTIVLGESGVATGEHI